MNELIFSGHTIACALFILFAARWSKDALMAATALLWVLANLFVTKQISLFGLNATASDAFVVGGTLGTTLMIEFYGNKEARRSVWVGFFVLGAFALFSWIHRLYTPSVYDTMDPHFAALLSPMTRLLMASLLAYVVSQNCCLYFARYFRNVRNPIKRNALILLLTQAVDTLTFTLFGLYGLASSLLSIMLISFLIKSIASLIMTPLVSKVRS